MTEPGDRENAATPAPSAPGDLRLRGEHPRVMRLSRKVLISAASIGALVVAAALGFGLRPHGRSGAGPELYDTQNHPEADGLASLPQTYTGLTNNVPKLGPPLPGDLGPAIINGHTAPSATVPAAGLNPDAQHLAQEQQAALASRLFVQTERQPGSGEGQSVGGSGPGPQTAAVPAGTSDIGLTAADQKVAFLNAPTDRSTVSPDRLEKPVSPYVVQAGTVIPAALITGIRSDLPGQIIAQVTQDVYDSPTGHYLLIPQGAKLIGQYDSSVTFGQNRVLLVWTRLIMPDGESIVLDRLPGADTQGYAGLYDQVNNHWGMLFEGAILSTVLSVGAEAGTSDSENNLAQAIRMGASNSVSQTGQQIVQRELDVQPTLTVRPGFPIDVMVTRDLVLAPYDQGDGH